MTLIVDNDSPAVIRRSLDAAVRMLHAGEVRYAMDVLDASSRTQRSRMSPSQWGEACSAIYRQHKVFDLLCEDPFTAHAFEQPRGYPGDAVLLDYMYGIREPSGASALGLSIFAHATDVPACRSVRWRRERLAKQIDCLTAPEGRPPRVLSVAAGHFREGAMAAAVSDGKVAVVALDQDQQSLNEIAAAYGGSVAAVHTTVRDILRFGVPDNIGVFDFVYAAGLFDYLDRQTATRLVRFLFDALAPGGRLLVANFCPELPNIGYMEAFMRWQLIYRDEGDMLGLLDGLEPEVASTAILERDDHQNVVYMTVSKP